MREKIVIPIEPTLSITSKPLEDLPTKKRVCAYARVSTEQEEQQTSYESQIAYYSKYIQEHQDWEYIGVYADEGTGTNSKNRTEFNKMIEDAKAGKIDLILTKSISRFARNTVLAIDTVRELKKIGVGVYFEKENIDTMDDKSEIVFTIFSSLAQEESRSISENIRWALEKRAQDGKVSIPYSSFLGYRKGADGIPEIDEDEAVVVRRIYNLYIAGNSINQIATILTADGIPTPRGKNKWSAGTVRSILTNEKYKGDAIINKTFTEDFITKNKRVNNGEVRKYYVKNSHPAIIKENIFDLVQTMLNQPSHNNGKLQNYNIFNKIIVCGECNEFYGHKVWNSRGKHRYDIWVCNHKSETTKNTPGRCKTPNIRQEKLAEGYLTAVREYIARNDDISGHNGKRKAYILSPNRQTRVMHREDKIKAEIAILESQLQDLVSNSTLKREDYEINKTLLSSKIGILEEELQEIAANEIQLHADYAKICRCELALEKQKSQPNKLLEDCFIDIIDKIIVEQDLLKYVFKNKHIQIIRL